MVPAHSPPDDLHARSLPLVEKANIPGSLVRLHRSDAQALSFSPRPGTVPRHRFDDPALESGAGRQRRIRVYRVGYFAQTLTGAFAETMLRSPGRRILALDELARCKASTFRVTRAPRLVRFHSSGLPRLGLTAAIANGVDYGPCRQWTRALFTHPERPDGLQYRSRHDDEQLCVALFDRARRVLVPNSSVPIDPFTTHLGDVTEWLERYDMGIV